MRINEKIIRDHFRLRTEDQDLATFIDGGFRENFTQEFWLVPKGAETPQPSNTLPKPTIPTDRTFQFAFEYLIQTWDDPIEFLNAEVRAERLKEEKELGRKENGETDSTEVELKLTEKEMEDIKFGWAISDFGKILKDRDDSTGAIIFYVNNEHYSVRNIKKHVEEGKKRIAKEASILPSRIQIIFGGYRGGTPEVEFWVILRGGKLPKPTPEKQEN